MTKVPEAYEQAKKHIFFKNNYCITTKSDSRMNSINKAICYAVINMYSLCELFTVHNTPQWYIQCTLSTQTMYFLPAKCSELVRK